MVYIYIYLQARLGGLTRGPRVERFGEHVQLEGRLSEFFSKTVSFPFELFEEGAFAHPNVALNGNQHGVLPKAMVLRQHGPCLDVLVVSLQGTVQGIRRRRRRRRRHDGGRLAI